MPTISDDIYINDALGNRLLAPRDWTALEYARAENSVGALVLTLPATYDRSLWKKDGIIEVWRSVDGSAPYLDTETVWLIRGVKKVIKNTIRYWELHAVDLNDLLRRRYVDYASGAAQSDQNRACDDMIKQIARENMGAQATDTTRSISTYLTSQPNFTLAPTISKAFSERNVLTVMQEIAQASFQNGTYLVFDVVCSVPPASGSAMAFELRTYTGQRGVDHRFPGGNPPVLLGPDFANMDDVEYFEDASAEVTRSIVGWQGVAGARTFYRTTDSARVNESPFNLVEKFSNASGQTNTTSAQKEADALVKGGRPRRTLTGKITQTTGLVYGVQFKWGDYVTAQVDGFSIDAHIDRIHVKFTRGEHELVDAFIRAEA